MCSYNKINGTYGSTSPALTEILKQDWGFEGFVVSDWEAVLCVQALCGGLDLEMPGPKPGTCRR